MKVKRRASEKETERGGGERERGEGDEKEGNGF